ncbi:amino acid ABC transporter substrate-binding protein [Fructobacillus sp. CRL 2054]|uniref:amino acid ABC transporter substrate-binding protein n=1 Tax=Fructobacillus sp. CRL 2054 TaxID=2763007 RepID=UPI0023785EC9|nr:amino acid ABC transporter substrate-binding protein [Fructobacillus sp. CRL 2054]MDD9138010.1 amino acid ABC transporter substrate-binding protein [Fructobacillus sp. CRL 2054]
MKKTNNKKKVTVNAIIGLVLIAIIGSVFFFMKSGSDNGSSGQKDQWSRIEKNKTITIGLDDTFVPMGFRDNSGKIVGFDIDLANKVFANLGIKVKWQPIDWSMKETELKTGNIDAIWNGYSKTAERAKKVNFSKVYHTAPICLVTKKSANINKYSDMKNKVLGVQTQSSPETALNNQPKVLKQYIKDQQAVGYDTFDKAFDDLNSDRITGILVDEDYARYYLKQQGTLDNYNIIDGQFESNGDVVGFRKSDKTLQKKVNEQLEKLEKNGYMKTIENKWFG